MSNFLATKVLALPATLAPNTVYFVADADDADLIKVYVSTNDGLQARRVPTMTDIVASINDIVTSANSVEVTGLYADLSGVDFNVNGPTKMVLVLDATGDTSVSSGAATYVNHSGNWIKIAEHESQDLVLQWSAIQGRPTSSATAIDDAVAASHSHSNASVLELLTDNAGVLMYDGTPVATQFGAAEW